VKNLVCLLIKKIVMEKRWYVYILASRKWWVLYAWVTSNIKQRILQHKRWVFGWFTKKYCIHRLVRFQELSTITEAIEYEKVIKWWKRIKKIDLIEEENKERKDLSDEWK
jgi:putative endonuclease